MKHATLADIRRAAPHRKPGYIEACRLLGQPSPDGQSLAFTDEAHAQLRRDFAPPAEPPGLGDLVHAVAGPIARAVKWPCLKGNGTAELKPESPCARARARLNRIKI